MEKLVKRLSEETAKSGNLTDEQRQVVAYGLGALMQMLFLLVLTVIFSAVFHCFYEAITVFFAVGLLKGGTGGAHAGTETACTVISFFTIAFMALLSRYVIPVYDAWPFYAAATLAAFAVSGYVIYKRAPVESPNKPIRRPEKIRRLRKRCFITLGIFLCFCAAMLTLGAAGCRPRAFSVSNAMALAVLWQAFMLTKRAQKWISVLTLSTKSEG